MRKIIISITIVGVLLFGVVAVNATKAEPTTIGKWIGSSIQSFLTDSKNQNKGPSLDRIVGTILDEEITATDLAVRAKLFELSGSKTPLEDAWNSMKVQAYEKQFAEEHNIYPTEQEIIAFTEKQRALVESAPGGQAYAKSIVEAAGMTEDEYWKDYKIKKESPAHLTSIKVAEYIAANNLSELTKEEILKSVQGEITDQSIIEEFK